MQTLCTQGSQKEVGTTLFESTELSLKLQATHSSHQARPSHSATQQEFADVGWNLPHALSAAIVPQIPVQALHKAPTETGCSNLTTLVESSYLSLPFM